MMSNNKHTVEKWVYQSSQIIKYENGCPEVVIGQRLCEEMGQDVAKKIVKDHNALAGIDDPEKFMEYVKDIINSEEYSCYCDSGGKCSVHVIKQEIFPQTPEKESETE